MPKFFKQLFDLKAHELRIAIFSASYFFLLLCAYYILRPIRETMGIARGAENLPYLFLATMVVTLLLAPVIGALVSKFDRRIFIPKAYYFIASNLVAFFIALKLVETESLFYVGLVFYIWLTVINLLLISLFWGFMSDGISFENSKRLFPAIAVGGTMGAVSGSTIAQKFIDLVGQSYLLLIAVGFLFLAVKVMKRIDLEFKNSTLDDGRKEKTQLENHAAQLQIAQRVNTKSNFSNWSSGIRYAISSPYLLAIAGYIFFYSITSTFLYFQQGQLIADASDDSSERLKIFANIDMWTNILTLLMQLFISREILKRFSIGLVLAGLPMITLIGFISLSFYQTLSVLIIFQALRRSLNYGLFKPAREMLFTLLPTEQKYKAKSFLDTFIYRSGDAAGAMTQKALISLQLGLASIALLVVPIAGLWSLLAIFLGVKASKLSREQQIKQKAET